MRRAAGRLFRLHRSSVVIYYYYSPHYNNIIPKQQELVKVYYRELVGIASNYMEFLKLTVNSLELVLFSHMLRHWNPVSLTLRPQIAYSHWLKMRPQRVNATGFLRKLVQNYGKLIGNKQFLFIF